MKIDKKKLERQQIGVNKWFETKKGTLHYFTGVGKTFTAILIIKRLFKSYVNHNVVIIVPSEALQNQWNNEINKHFTKKEQILISIFTVNYIITNNIKIKTNTLIVDELHEYYSEERIKVINKHFIQFDNCLGLTATYEDSKNRELQLQKYFPVIDEIAEEEAIREGYISPYVEFNFELDFTEEERKAYSEYSKIINDSLNKFNRSFDLANKCLSGGKHTNGQKYEASHFVYGWATHKGWHKNLNLEDPRDKQINDLWNPHKIFGYATKLMSAIRKRKDLIYLAENKFKISSEIIFKFNSLKTIVFSQSTNFADRLNLELNDLEKDISVVYHSKLTTQMLPSPKTGKLIKFGPKRLKQLAIDNITNDKSRVLNTSSALDKGLNIPSITMAITTSGTSNSSQYKQRGGRAKRINILDSTKKAILINLYIKNTVEKKWLDKRQSNSNHFIYNVNTLKDLSFNPINRNEFNIKDL